MADVIGVSAGRKNKVTESLVRAIIESTGKTHELISLSGKKVHPCEACNGCARSNRCILDDDFQDIADNLYKAKGLVFGAPTYWDGMNSLGRAFWERLCFSGRHNGLFPLAGKPGVIVAVDGVGDGKHVRRDVGTFFDDARIHLAGSLTAQGEYACFSCGYGNYCSVGGFVGLFPLGTPITRKILPSITNQHPEVDELDPAERNILPRAMKMGEILAKVIDFQEASKERFRESKDQE